MRVILIAAVAANNVIGNKGDLAWNFRDYPEDMKRFRKETTGHTVLMGRKTYESIGNPLPNRRNMVVSRTMEELGNILVFKDVNSAFEAARSNAETLFVIGGQTIYEQTLNYATELHITHIDENYEGDVYFPRIDCNRWKMDSQERVGKLTFCNYILRPIDRFEF